MNHCLMRGRHCAKPRISKYSRYARMLAFVSLVLLCLAACSPLGAAGQLAGGHHGAASSKDGSWTVLVYLCGSNLETSGGYATHNLKELVEAEVPENVTFAIQTGGANGWRNDWVDADALQRFTVDGGELVLCDEQPRASMGSTSTFADFLSWGTSTYPADHYVLVFWDHGGGSLSGVCLDELDGDTLTLPEIREGLESTDVTFDVVGFDTCLMATLETAEVLAPHARYLVASEELEPAEGWAWDAWPAWFATAEGEDAAGLGVCICDTYMQRCEANGVADAATMSVVDLSRMGEVTDAFEAAAEDMAFSTEQPVEMQRLVQDARDVESFGHASYIEGYTDMVDLSDLMACVEESVPESAAAVREAVDDAVVYEVHGQYRSEATGLSVFYPLNIDLETFMGYFDVLKGARCGNVPYLQYLAVRTGAYDQVNWGDWGVEGLSPVNEERARNAFSCRGEINADDRYQVVITGDTRWVGGATFRMGDLLDDGTVVMLGSDNNMDLEIDTATGKVTYTDRFTGHWMCIGGCYAYAEIVDMVAEDDAPSYNLYSVPVELTREDSSGERTTVRTDLLVSYDYPTDSYEVLCAYEKADETGMAPKSTAALREGDELRFLVEREVDGQIQGGSTGSIVWSDDVTVETRHVGEGNFVYIVEVTDIFGNVYTPDPVLFTFADGTRYAKMLEMG